MGPINQDGTLHAVFMLHKNKKIPNYWLLMFVSVVGDVWNETL